MVIGKRCVLLPCRRKFSVSIAEMLVVCANTVHRVGLKTPVNELCPLVPIMAWNTCAFTIQAIGSTASLQPPPLHLRLLSIQQMLLSRSDVQYSAKVQ